MDGNTMPTHLPSVLPRGKAQDLLRVGPLADAQGPLHKGAHHQAHQGVGVDGGCGRVGLQLHHAALKDLPETL